MYGESSQRVIWSAHAPFSMLDPPCGRRGCNDAVIQSATASSGRSAASLPQRYFCARQAGTVFHSASEKKKPGSWNYRGLFNSSLPSFIPFLFLFSSFAKMNLSCVILACSLLVGASVVRWVHFYACFCLTAQWKCCTAVVLSCCALHELLKVVARGPLCPAVLR